MKRRVQSAILAFCMLITMIGGIIPANLFTAHAASAPVITPGTGLRFYKALTLTMSAEEGASIYYTTDGSDPTNAGTIYTGAIEITDSCTIKAISVTASGTSEVAEAKYIKESTIASPLVYDFTVLNSVRRGGTKQNVQISDAVDYATTDSCAAQINGASTAPWYNGGKSASTQWINQDTGNRINGKGEWGSFKIYVPENGIYDISGGIYYTNRADYQGDAAVYLAPVEAQDRTSDNYLLKQMSTASTRAAIVATELKSGVALAAGEYYYTQKAITAPYFWAGTLTLTKVGEYTPPAKMPTSSLVSGEYIGAQEITLSTASANAKIYYTTDGTDPDATDIEYTGAITVSESMTIKAITIKNGFANSEIVTFDYVIVPPLPYAGEENSIVYDMQIAGTASITPDYDEYNETGLNPNWKYIGNQDGAARAYYGGVRFASSSTSNPWVAFKIKVGAAGRYMAKMKYKGHFGANSADVYIIPGDTQDISSALNAATPVGSVTYIQDAALSTLQNIKLGEVQFDKEGEYILAVRTKEAGAQTGGAGIGGTSFSIFELSGEAPSPLDSISLYISNTAISPSAPAQASVSGTLANGKAADLSAENLAIISYTSSDNTVATVDGTGVITALKAGKATITVTVTLDSVTLKASKEISCVEYGGADTTFTLDLMNGLAENGEIVGALTEYNAEKNTNWVYFGNYMDEPLLAKTRNGSVVFQASDADAWSAIAFDSKEAGLYQLKMEYKNHAGASKVAAYLLSGDARKDKLDAIIASSTPINTVALKSGAEVQSAHFGEVALNENTRYILVLKSAKAGTDASVGIGTITANTIIFSGEEGEAPTPVIEEVSITAPENMSIGSKTTAKVSGTLVSGAAADMSIVDCSFASSNEAVATVDEKTGEITAVSDGKADITVTASLGGETVSASCTINVVKRDSELSYTNENVTYDFVSCLAKSYEQLATLPDYNPAKNTNWAYGGYFDGSTNKMQSYYGTIRISAKTADAWAAIKIKSPSNGIYKASLTWAMNAGAKSAYVYLIPATVEDIAAALETATPIGEIDYWANGDPATLSGTQTVDLGEVEINGQAEYYLVLKCKETCAQNTAAGIATMHISTFTLNSSLPLNDIDAILVGGTTDLSMNVGATAQIQVSTPSNPIEAEQATITYKSLTPDVLSVSETGAVTALANGIGEVEITATLGEYTNTFSVHIVAGTVKNRRSYYTDEEVANARENIEKYAWARTTMETAVKAADKYVGKEEYLWKSVTTQNLPRSYWMALRNDPEYRLCPYCKVDIWTKYGNNEFLYDAFNDPWKVQCPDCRRKFPSNDFGSYYELGIDEHGNWQPELSKQRNDELVANGEDGYLKNVLFPEMGEGWGVDDGYGWVTGRTFDVNGTEVIENKCFIAWYNEWALWTGSTSMLIGAANNLRLAYLYTGEAKYGRVGAILTDRMADVYPDMDLKPFAEYFNADGGNKGLGRVLGKIPDYNLAEYFGMNYDGFWPAMEDEYVINFLSEKAEKYNMENPKTSAELIRLNCDNGLLREINKGVRDGRINSNFGHNQRVMATAAVTLDTMPETGDWIDWIFDNGPDPSASNNYANVAGDVSGKLMDSVDRDGQGNEAAPAYNVGWISSLIGVADALAGYDKYEAADLYKHPKVQKMITSQADLIVANRYTPLIGDTGNFAAPLLPALTTNLVRAWYNGIKTDNIARMLYLINEGDISNIHAEIFVKDPESIQDEIQDVVDSGVAMDVGSKNMTGYGLAILRGGEWVDGSYGIDTQRAYWMWYGPNSGHGHHDKLNLGIYAYGLDFAPDNGQPEIKTVDAKRYIWVESPLSHNTVMVVDHTDETYSSRDQKENMISTPLHFDDSGVVKVMDADASEVHSQTDVYRRTVVTVNALPDVDYAVDFFRVKGGEDHLYSFHAQSNEVSIEGADLVAQEGGTYAGADVPWGADPLWSTKNTSTFQYPQGFTYLDNVHRAANPTSKTISADFVIEDYHEVLKDADGLHLKLTMLNDSELTEFAVVDAEPPQYVGVPKRIKQIIARRTGENLDSLYTTVIQPYKGEAYIESVEEVDIEIADGIPGKADAARAVKVTLKSGRIDYIIYATNKHVVYKVDDLFEFSGIIGVYSITKDSEGNIKPIYSYVNDGTKIADVETISEYTGTVESFTTELSANNEIEVTLNQDVDPATLVGKYIYVNNDGVQNASYLIEDAYDGENGKVIINVGDVTLIRQHIEPYNVDAGYIYNINAGQSFSIPVATLESSAPVFDPIGNKSVEAGSELKFTVNAESPIGNEVTYKALSIPRGAQFDETTGAFAWIPDSALIGTNIAIFEATDGMASSYYTIEIEVHNATGGTSPSAGVTTPGSMGPGSTTAPDDGKTDEENPDDSGNTGDTDDKTKRFIDLGNHKWAEDAIYRLVDLGVINGTSENTYSPGNAITRADFTTLIVRAFDFTAETTESFPDVESGKYYTDTIAIAKALGIVNGDSKGNFNPMASITRQDMMVIIARAASVAGIDLSGDVENSFPDMDKVSDYAKDAVELLISSGIIAGSNGLINPLGTTTRAEVAVVLDRLVLFGK